MQKELAKLIEKLYNVFYSKFYNREFKLNLELNKNGLQIENFVALLARHYNIEGININFLINYLSFSFSRRFGQNTKRDISLGWIIGPKALKSFLEKKEGETFYTDQFVNKIGINLDELKLSFHEGLLEEGLNHAEELEKQRASPEARLFACLQFTTLYNHRSPICMTCSNKLDCKKLLRTQFPSIFKKRGYSI